MKIRFAKQNINLIVAFLIVAIVIFTCFSVYYDDYTTINEPDQLEPNDITGEITSGRIIRQSFVCSNNKLKSFSLLLAIYGRTNNCTLSVSLFDDAGLIQEWEVKCSQLADNTYYPFLLDEQIEDCKDNQYTIEISSDGIPSNAITIYKNTTSQHSGLVDNGVVMPGESLCFYLEYENALLDSAASPFIIRFIIAVCLILLGWIALLRFKVKDEWMFLYLWCSFSILFSISLTLFNVPDEYNHFYRAYEISCGDMLADYDTASNSVGYELPISSDLSKLMTSWQSFSENKDFKITPDNPTFFGFYNTATYSPISYLPQSIGIFIARQLTENIALIAYAGRFANWLCITALLIMALRMIPCGKKVLMIIALMPMNIHESISLAPDGMVVAISIFLIAYILYCVETPNTLLKKRNIFVLYTLGICISLYKIVYLPFCLLFFLIPKTKFKNGMKGKIMHAIICCICFLGLNLGWLMIARRYLLTAGTDGQAQLQYMLKNLPEFYLIMNRTFMRLSDWYLFSSVGSLLGWNISTIPVLIIAYLFMYVHSLNIGVSPNSEGTLFRKCVFGSVIISIILLIAASLYIQWTPVYKDVIDGIQGRYFLPLLLPAYFALSRDKFGASSKLPIGYQSVILITNLCAACSMLFACI